MRKSRCIPFSSYYQGVSFASGRFEKSRVKLVGKQEFYSTNFDLSGFEPFEIHITGVFLYRDTATDIEDIVGLKINIRFLLQACLEAPPEMMGDPKVAAQRIGPCPIFF